MDKKLLSDYIDACELIRETEQQIRRLRAKQSETTQDSVRGSNPEFPYNAQHFKIEGTTFSMRDDARLLEKKKLLAARREAASEAARIANNAWGQGIAEWISQREQAGEYPALDGYVCTGIGISTPFYFGASDNGSAVYQVTIKIEYRKEKSR